MVVYKCNKSSLYYSYHHVILFYFSELPAEEGTYNLLYRIKDYYTIFLLRSIVYDEEYIFRC